MTDPILVIGMTAAGVDGLPAALIERILDTDLLAGGKRHLSYFPDFAGERLPITASVEVVAQRLRTARSEGLRTVVLASGDPLCFGIGASLRRYFAADELEIVPAPTAFQLAFAALGEPWHDARLLSAHARPLADVVARVIAANASLAELGRSPMVEASEALAAVLTDNDQTPSVIAQELIDAGMAGSTLCAVCENLGSDSQQIVRTDLMDVSRREFAALNVFVVWSEQGEWQSSRLEQLLPHPNLPQTGKGLPRGDQSSRKPAKIDQPVTVPSLIRGGLGRGQTWGNPDDAFATSAAQITKREVRLLALAELQLGPNGVLWDIGAGSGSVGIEAALGQPSAQVYAVEKRAEFVEHMHENLRRFPAAQVHITQGSAPDVCAEWPDPSAIFVGGSGGRLSEIIAVAQSRLQIGGRLVINLATLENLQTARDLLPDARISQVQISRGVPIAKMTRFDALNPIFMVMWQKF